MAPGAELRPVHSASRDSLKHARPIRHPLPFAPHITSGRRTATITSGREQHWSCQTAVPVGRPQTCTALQAFGVSRCTSCEMGTPWHRHLAKHRPSNNGTVVEAGRWRYHSLDGPSIQPRLPACPPSVVRRPSPAVHGLHPSERRHPPFYDASQGGDVRKK
jgi:hypothetical protein